MAIAIAQPRTSYDRVEQQLAMDGHELAAYPSTYGDKIRFAQDLSAKLTRHARQDGPLFGRLCQLAETVKRLDRSGDRVRAEKEARELISLVDTFLYTPAATVTISEYHETPEQIEAAVAAGIARRAAEAAREAAVKQFIVDRTAPAVKFVVDRSAPAVSFVKFVASGVTSVTSGLKSKVVGVATKAVGATSRLSGLVNFRRNRNGTFAVSKREYSGQHRLVACPPDHPYLTLGELYGITLREGERCEVRKQDASTVNISPMDGFEVQVSREDFAQYFDVVAPEVGVSWRAGNQGSRQIR